MGTTRSCSASDSGWTGCCKMERSYKIIQIQLRNWCATILQVGRDSTFTCTYTVYHLLEGRGFVCFVFDPACVHGPKTHEISTSKQMINSVDERRDYVGGPW